MALKMGTANFLKKDLMVISSQPCGGSKEEGGKTSLELRQENSPRDILLSL